jgi:gamma-glutamyltranspeptidase
MVVTAQHDATHRREFGTMSRERLIAPAIVVHEIGIAEIGTSIRLGEPLSFDKHRDAVRARALGWHDARSIHSIVDRWGNAVAFTYTLNDSFGADVVAENTGFFLNDEMDDFTSKPGVPNLCGLVQGTANALAPGNRPLSSMAPTIVTSDGTLRMVTGSPGGSRIAQAAVDAPRTQMQSLPDQLRYEPSAFSEPTLQQLVQMGYTLRLFSQWGSTQAVVVDPQTGLLAGGSDRRTPAGSADEGY